MNSTIWVYADAFGRVLGASGSDMTGNTGWYQTVIEGELPEALTDADGVALYALVDGELVARSAEEIVADRPEPNVDTALDGDDVIEILGDYEYRLCLLEMGVSEDDL